MKRAHEHDPQIAAILRRGELYGHTEILLQHPERELTPAEAALLRAGVYCGIAATLEELTGDPELD